MPQRPTHGRDCEYCEHCVRWTGHSLGHPVHGAFVIQPIRIRTIVCTRSIYSSGIHLDRRSFFEGYYHSSAGSVVPKRRSRRLGGGPGRPGLELERRLEQPGPGLGSKTGQEEKDGQYKHRKANVLTEDLKCNRIVPVC